MMDVVMMEKNKEKDNSMGCSVNENKRETTPVSIPVNS